MVSESELMVEIADGIKVRVMRAMVSDVMAKTEPADNDDDDDDNDDDDKDGKRKGKRKGKSKD